MSLQHWRIEDQDNIAIVTLDVAGASANALSQAVLDEFDKLLDPIP